MLLMRTMVSISMLLLGWQLLTVILQLPPYILPSPLAVAASIQANYILLLKNLSLTALETVLGLGWGSLLGVSIALIMMAIPLVRFWLLPIIIISQAVPIFAIAPMLVMWLGYGMLSKIITVALMLFFPVASSFYDGLAQTNSDWLDMGAIMTNKRLPILWYIRLPAALPSLAAGLRVAVVLAPMGAVVSEWVGASQGLGYLMLNANSRLQIDLMFACLIILMVFSLLLYAVVSRLIAKFITW